MDCTACGACCASAASPEHVGVTLDDVARLPAAARVHVVETATYRALATSAGRCLLLAGVPGEAVSCTIYEARPDACRAFVAGGRECSAARHMWGLL